MTCVWMRDEKDEPIHADKNKKTMAYTYDVTEIEVLPGTLDSAETTRSPQRKPSISTDTLLKGVENVNGNLTLSGFLIGAETGGVQAEC